jgi:hypothetical protein
MKLPDLQHHLLDQETLLVEVSLGESRSHPWSVTSSSFQGFGLAEEYCWAP